MVPSDSCNSSNLQALRVVVPNIMGLVGKRVLPKAALNHAHRHGWLDLKLGFALLRDKRVTLLTKLAALATGVTLTAILFALEFPIEAIVGALLPFLGVALDFAVDGIEFLILPLLLVAVVIRWMSPKAIVESLRR